MKIQTYNDMRVTPVQMTSNPCDITGMALAITMKSNLQTPLKPLTSKQGLFLVLAEHMSVFEHVQYTFLIEGISRSLLAQLTRQRASSFTSGSQHYQDYHTYPAAISAKSLNDGALANVFGAAFDEAQDTYYLLTEARVPREEARQVLPNAMTVNLLWTIDARNLFWFLRHRLCNRNVEEMKVFANRVRYIACEHFPELFNWSGPQCAQGTCMQGHLQCKEGVWDIA